ncbi:transcription factor grauzone-like [Anopheles aquasalis]|uniref:transcription factor grauzone-like n=1 Tax=Anopheles aquasalis TaxID=42839 RepID=UPI00215A1D74|nr:transcription factor grauzone-like [Anopheles aquasalis]
MDEKCRLCLVEITEHSKSIEDAAFQKKLVGVFNFQIVSQPPLPVLVCGECDSKVTEYYAFHEEVRANQDKLWVIRDDLEEEEEEDKLAPEEEQQEGCFETVKLESELPTECSTFEDTADEELLSEHLIVKEEPMEEEHILDSEVATSFEANESTDPDEGSATEREDPEYDPISPPEPTKDRPRRSTVVRKLPRKPKQKAVKSTERCTKEAFEEQNRRLQEFYTMKCELCGEMMDCFTSLKGHYQRQHKIKGYISCCGRTFHSRYRLLEHLSYHVGSSMVRCDVCNKSFSTRSYLQVHKSRVHGTEEDRPYKCNQCHQSYTSECHLKAHLVSHVRVSCDICQKVLASSLSLRVHMVNIHGNREMLICDSCGKEFRTRQAFDRHVNQHMGIDQTEHVQCSLCSKWLGSKRALKVHIQLVHNEAGQTFKCDQCPHESPNSRAMANHKQRVHVDLRFECDVCGKRFKRQLYLKEHIALHTGKPLYSCEICGATFNSNANKYSHRKNKHPVEWEALRKPQITQATSG